MDTEAQVQHNFEEMPTTGKLLSIQERSVCEQLAVGTEQHNQWARALLAIDEGASRSEAAQRAGMTSRQVRYWLAKFRKLGLGIFPRQALEYAAEELLVSAPAPIEGEEQAESASQEVKGSDADESLEAKVEEATVMPKAKKSKDKKKKKKGKKGKDKGKKGKSNKDKPPKKSKKGGKKKSKKDKR